MRSGCPTLQGFRTWGNPAPFAPLHFASLLLLFPKTLLDYSVTKWIPEQNTAFENAVRATWKKA